ncbi:unnamed protein product [Macrosiphum euphorbiae]|uniref:Uncharacterized protein n=1 Tax=Macrosiphum euphorbiae TaxID=13131 RepID=A0AAV0W8Q2_9HEMI|nr:unnamed protein product [Macrosiphum euphorbiae]
MRLKPKSKNKWKFVDICLIIPPATFEWQYYDKSKVFKTIGHISPLDFYLTHVRPVFDVVGKVCLISNPQQDNP